MYKFGGQPYANDFLNTHYSQTFVNIFGLKNGKAMTHACAGSLIGVGEIVLLPLDVLKIKRQTNPEAFRGRGVARIVMDEGFSLYRGWGWTAARNAPGSFAVCPLTPSVCVYTHVEMWFDSQLFGGSAFTKEYIFGLNDYAKATWTQNFVASIAGSVSLPSWTVSSACSPVSAVSSQIAFSPF